MEQRSANIVLDGRQGTIEINGHDISRAVRGLKVEASVYDLPSLTLDLVVHATAIEGEMHVLMPDATTAALVALGWTPPSADGLGTTRQHLITMLRTLAPEHPVTRVWGRLDTATAEQGQEGNAWAADIHDLADLMIKALASPELRSGV